MCSVRTTITSVRWPAWAANSSSFCWVSEVASSKGFDWSYISPHFTHLHYLEKVQYLKGRFTQRGGGRERESDKGPLTGSLPKRPQSTGPGPSQEPGTRSRWDRTRLKSRTVSRSSHWVAGPGRPSRAHGRKLDGKPVWMLQAAAGSSVPRWHCSLVLTYHFYIWLILNFELMKKTHL